MKIFNPYYRCGVRLLALAAMTCGLVWLPSDVWGQAASVRVEENVRAEPGGQVIGQLQAGTPVRTGRSEGNWVQATFRGWVWSRSLQAREGGAFDLRVSAPGGENLRDGPQGSVIGRMIEGALFQEVGREPGWIEVQRTAWIWSPSIQASAADLPPEPSTRPSTEPSATSRATPRTSSIPEGDEWLRTSEGPSPLLASPDGDTVATARSGADLRVLSREGNWARVRLEGWVWSPELEPLEGAEAPSGEITPEVLAADPDLYRGQTVTWEVQFISSERAEPIRTDFYEGEPFILARYGGESGTFIYVAFPPDRLLQVETLTPLERIVIVGRIREGRAALTGNPILDLLEIRVPED